MELNEIKIKDQRVVNHLVTYLNKIEQYKSFDLDQPISLFVSLDNDLIALESERYSWGFTSYSHKPSEVRSATFLSGVPYRNVRSWLDQINLPF